MKILLPGCISCSLKLAEVSKIVRGSLGLSAEETYIDRVFSLLGSEG